MGVAISIIRYADDADIPAETLEDLRTACRVLKMFCNDHRLYIATAKNFLTVFHHLEDSGVVYENDTVIVDGTLAVIQVYGEQIVPRRCSGA